MISILLTIHQMMIEGFSLHTAEHKWFEVRVSVPGLGLQIGDLEGRGKNWTRGNRRDLCK